MLYINGFILTSSTNEWNVLFKYQIHFQINGRKLKNIQTNSEAWILIKFQFFMCQWICINKLYKLMESFLQI